MRTLFFVVFLDLIGFGMIIPVFPFYAETVGVEPASVIFFLGLYSFGQLVGAPVWGALSDRYGRRPVLLVTLLANAAASWMLGLANTGLLLGISRVVAGVAAGNISTAYAYATDITDDASRPKAMGLLGSAFGAGFILGPALGGVLAMGSDGSGGLSRVANAAAILSLVAFFLTLLRLPESMPAGKRGVQGKRPGMLTYFRRPVLRDLLLSTVIVIAAVALLQSALAVWAAERMNMGPTTLGWVYGFVGALSVAVQIGAIDKLTRRFGAERLTRAGAVLIGIGIAALPPVSTMTPLLAALALFSVGSALFNPSMSYLVSNAAEPHERGSVLGAYQGAASFGRVIGPFAGSAIARVTSLSWPFIVGAAVSLIGALLIHAQGNSRRGRE
jgi:DHA1 family tetracycline resistance protein-like MFS transporter